jgi:hypothetical protein
MYSYLSQHIDSAKLVAEQLSLTPVPTPDLLHRAFAEYDRLKAEQAKPARRSVKALKAICKQVEGCFTALSLQLSMLQTVLPWKFTNARARSFYMKYLHTRGVSIKLTDFLISLRFDLETSNVPFLPQHQTWAEAALAFGSTSYVDIRELDAFFTLLTLVEELASHEVQVANYHYVRTEGEHTRYLGELTARIRHGVGVEVDSKGRIYSGSWRQGGKDGPGYYQFADGRRYLGSFAQNKMLSGKKLMLTDDTFYQGEVADDGSRHGKGSLYNYDNELLCEGYWEMDKVKQPAEGTSEDEPNWLERIWVKLTGK